MGKAYVFFADGLEEIEALTVVDILRRGEIETDMISITGELEIEGSHGIGIRADRLFEDTDFSDADLLVLPGGMPGTLHLGEHQGLADLLRKADSEGTEIAAICAAPSVLGDMGLLQGRAATCYPGMEERLAGAKISRQEVVESGNYITSRGMGTAIPFALALLGKLKGREAAEKMAAGIVFRAD